MVGRFDSDPVVESPFPTPPGSEDGAPYGTDFLRSYEALCQDG
ncbi:MAG: hypothetical protein ABW185_08330 [Sedimenticola sp.]